MQSISTKSKGDKISSGDFNPRNKVLTKETVAIDPVRPASPHKDDMAAE